MFRFTWLSHIRCIFQIALALIILNLAAPASAQISDRIRALAPNGLVFVQAEDGTELVSQNADKAFVPASVVKIANAWLAIGVLGADYRFETHFFLDDDRMLHVRGGGDPFLVSEEIDLLAQALLKATGTEPFSGLVIDTSYFPEDLTIPGIEADYEAYSALNGALAANFNTINARRSGNTVTSAETQTPITPLAIEQFKKRGPKNGRRRISLTQQDPQLGARYAGELIAAFIEKHGGKVEGEISFGRPPDEAKPIYVHRQSRTLMEIIEMMMRGSNNYMANQIFLEAGARAMGAPVSIEKSLALAKAKLAANGISEITLVEGSGISEENRFTARGLVQVLDAFAPYAHVMKKTRRGSFYKTGTLDNVSTLAGYAMTQNHGLARFVIALPGRTGRLRFNLLAEIEKGL